MKRIPEIMAIVVGFALGFFVRDEIARSTEAAKNIQTGYYVELIPEDAVTAYHDYTY